MKTDELEYSSDVEVELVSHHGTDLGIAKAAWVSTLGSNSSPEDLHTPEELESKLNGLIGFLIKNRHGTPFEHNSMTFRVSAPLFVWREHHRHRVGFSYNEESGRYKKLDPKFYIPAPDRALIQQGKPGHYEYVAGTDHQYDFVVNSVKASVKEAYWRYEAMLGIGIAREVARIALPLNTYSTCYVTCNARSLMSFLALRTKSEDSYFPSYPQREIEMVAEKYEKIFAEKFPITYKKFNEAGRVSP